jgi:hypothetical protein
VCSSDLNRKAKSVACATPFQQRLCDFSRLVPGLILLNFQQVTVI